MSLFGNVKESSRQTGNQIMRCGDVGKWWKTVKLLPRKSLRFYEKLSLQSKSQKTCKRKTQSSSSLKTNQTLRAHKGILNFKILKQIWFLHKMHFCWKRRTTYLKLIEFSTHWGLHKHSHLNSPRMQTSWRELSCRWKSFSNKLIWDKKNQEQIQEAIVK